MAERLTNTPLADKIVDLQLSILEITDVKERTRMLKNAEKYFDLEGWTVLINEANKYNVLDDQER